MNKDFAIFILSHWRPNTVYTYNTLKKIWYTWKIYILCDDEDKQLDKYIEKYWDKILVFSKKDVWLYTDSYDSQPWYKSVVYARNATFNLAKELWLKYFMQLDDDYMTFTCKYNNKLEFSSSRSTVKDFDKILEYMVKFVSLDKVMCIALAQEWDFIWWENNWFVFSEIRKRKIMNSFLCSVDKPFLFRWELNDDVNTYVALWNQWYFFYTIPWISINQKITQSNPWWLTDIYLEKWTYIKSFCTVMTSPSSVKITTMWISDRRIHHKIKRNYTVPRVLHQDYKKI